MAGWMCASRPPRNLSLTICSDATLFHRLTVSLRRQLCRTPTTITPAPAVLHSPPVAGEFPGNNKGVSLGDKYMMHGDGRQVFLTGTQALVRLPLVQRHRDRQAGLNTAGYITGYRGSPLGTYDSQLWQAGDTLAAYDVTFQAGLNEDLAATAIAGAQQVALYGRTAHDGIFALWYGKGPGVDRSGDAFKHGNQIGSSPHGGVLLCVGDDHTGKSSTTCHQSEFALVDAGIPVLNPAGIEETLEYGLLGIAMSRFAGCWVALKTTSANMDSSATVSTRHEDMRITIPAGFPMPPDGVHARFPDDRALQEARLLNVKLPAAAAFARENGLDRVIVSSPAARIGIISTGKSYLDVRQALLDLGLSDERCAALGITLYKVGMPWPLDPTGLQGFVAGLEEVLVVEEKRALVESQVKEHLFNLPDDRRPRRVTGKRDHEGNEMLRSTLDLTPELIAQAIAARVLYVTGIDVLPSAATRQDTATETPMTRAPYFCAGCPHNTSTQLPDGSSGLAGIGCSTLSMWMPGSGRETFLYSQMGGEGMHWVGAAPFSSEKHMFANLGDGTYTHSGLLAIRAAVASNTCITYKILYNDAVAMTGGQTADCGFSVAQITRQLAAEGVSPIYVVTDDLEKHERLKAQGHDYDPEVKFAHRRELIGVQMRLRECEGTSALVYEQTCAAEKRRRRKRGTFPDPDERLFINAGVCEGCGDCGKKSNCVAVQPLETPLGRKRMINQSSCNKDFSCAEGFCPSFVTVKGGRLRKKAAGHAPLQPSDIHPADISPTSLPENGGAFSAVVCGIGGTGVVTMGAILAMAAHIEGKYATVLDDVGMAQKNGAVYSHLRIAARASAEPQKVKVGAGECDLLLATDMVAAANPEIVATIGRLGALGGTACLLNTKQQMVGAFATNPDLAFPGTLLEGILRDAVGVDKVFAANYDDIAAAILGDAIMSNSFTLGVAYQRGLLPLDWQSIEEAFRLNNVAVEANIQAFRWGRFFVSNPVQVSKVSQNAAADSIELHSGEFPVTLEEVIAHRVRLLTAYQDAAYAEKYRSLVQRVRDAEDACGSAVATGSPLALAVAINYSKLLAYKDEYEVARLFTDGQFTAALAREFEGDYRLQFHLSPPWMSPRDGVTGQPRKVEFGPWVLPVFRLLARLKGLRGSRLDLFGATEERQMERRLIAEYKTMVEGMLPSLGPATHAAALAVAVVPQSIRGYGHVKRESIDRARRQQAEALAAFDDCRK